MERAVVIPPDDRHLAFSASELNRGSPPITVRGVDAAVELLQRVSRATVTVASKIPPHNPSAAILGTERFGSGAVVDRHGLVLTVNYVVLGAAEVFVVDVEGRRHAARVVAQDFATGIALLRTEISDLRPLDIATSDELSLGEDACVVASAGENERRCATGVVTSLDPFDATWEYRLDRAVWLTCSNPGLGGAPACDRFGRLIGVVSLNLGNVGRATLAIPAECYKAHAGELLEHGRRVSRPARAWLGLFCYPLAERSIVAGVVPGSPVAVAGVESGDVITRVGSESVDNRKALYDSIWTHGAGETVELDIYREGQLLTFSVDSADVDAFFA